MGNVFPIYPPEDLGKLDKQKREELRAAIIHVLRFDPDFKKLLEEKLPDAKQLLRSKTDPVYQALLRRL
jgi:hypothetical protein